jgi:P-type Cu+ transporter
LVVNGPLAQPREVVLDVEGMTCASCVDRLQRVLNRQPNVSAASVSLASRTAAVRCSSPDPAPLIRAIERAGYGARLHDPTRSTVDEAKDYQRRLAVAAFCSFNVLVFSMIVAPSSRASMLAAGLFAAPVQLYGGWPFLRAAVRAARHGTYTMDTLVACGSLAAFGYSVAAALSRGHHAYFETSALIVTLILLGRVLEARARATAGDAARVLLERRPRHAALLERGEERQVPVQDLQAGDRVVVRPGENVPSDGKVRRGRSSIDLSMLTGESVPVDVGPGDEVVGGSLNGHGRLVIELTRVGEETRLAQIVRLLRVTQSSKAPIQRLADRVAAVFVPRILALALAVFLFLAFFGSQGLGGGLIRAAAVLLVACPCSLGLATPVAIMAGSGRAAELGILFKGGEVFEAARRVDTVMIDKTGTLTEASMSLRAIEPIGMTEEEVLVLAAAAEGGSEHPIGRCVVRAATERKMEVPEATDVHAEPGAGIRATVGSTRVRVGRPEGLSRELSIRAEELAARGLTVIAVWRDGEPAGLLGAFAALKEGAAEAVSRLRRSGWDVSLVSGDRRAAVEAAARAAGISRAVAEVFPEGKVEEVRRLQAAGKRVAFIGDGINDAPALAQADVGIALGTGTDVAMEAGAVLIMGGDIRLVADCLQLARRTYWVVAQNLAWAFAYNLLMIPLAVAGKVSPVVAAGVMAGSSVTVVGNALRLRGFGAARQARPRTARVRVTPSLRSIFDRPPSPAGDASATAAGARSGEPDRTGPVEAPPLTALARVDVKRIAGAMGRLLEKQWES